MSREFLFLCWLGNQGRGLLQLAVASSSLRRVIEMEKELTVVKSKYIRLLSDKFKIALPSERTPSSVDY